MINKIDETKNNIILVYTEYQLLQAEAIIFTYNLNPNILILGENSRINKNIINKDLFDEIIQFPFIFKNGDIKKLSLGYIKKVKEIYKDFKLGKSDVFIGASEENTGYNIIKYELNYKQYWNIEDGIGNYRLFDFKHNISIAIKNVLFRNVYGEKIKVSKQKGDDYNNLSFRISPSLSVNKGKHEDLSLIIKYYLQTNIDYFRKMISNQDNDTYLKKSILIVCEKEPLIDDKKLLQNAIIKPHPQYDLSKSSYFNYKIPVEILPSIYPNLKNIIYDSFLCSSTLNILTIYQEVKIYLNFDVKKRYYKNKGIKEFYNRLIQKYDERISHGLPDFN